MSTCRAAASSRTWRAPGTTRPPCCAISRGMCPTWRAGRWRWRSPGQGDGTWLIDARRRAGGPGLALARLACGRRSSASSTAAACATLVYRHTGCGMNACNQSAHLVWLKRHAPHAARPRRHRLPLQGLALLQAHRRARHRHLRRHLHLRRLPHPRLCARDAGGARARRRSAPAAADGGRQPGDPPARPRPLPPRPGLPEGLPVALGYLDVLCTGLGGGIYEPGRAIGCSIVGSTGMHMRFVPDAAGAAARPRAVRLHHAVSRCRAASPRCSPTWRRP